MAYKRAAYVRWRDACCTYTESIDHKDLGEPVELEELGWLIKETKEAIVLGLEYQPYARDSRFTLTIPKVNLVEYRTVKRADLLRWLRER